MSPQDSEVILNQLQSDAPQSPLVDLLRTRLSLDAGGPSVEGSRASTASCPDFQQPSAEIGWSSSGPSNAKESVNLPCSMPAFVECGAKVGRDCLQATHEKCLRSPPVSKDESQFRDFESGAVILVPEKGRKLESYVLVHNVAKRHNLGTIARSATAFGVSELILVGRKDFNAFGSHGASLHMQFRHFYTLPEASTYLKAKGVDICGVEIVEGATAVHKQPFTRSTAFVLGNEGTGLSRKEMEMCDFFVYIPQCGSGTASLNVTVAASIVLHHYAVWAGFTEREREGHKFLVAERPVRRTPRNSCADESPDAVKERRRHKADCVSDDWLLCDRVEETESEYAIVEGEETSIEFPSDRKSGLMGALNGLYS